MNKDFEIIFATNFLKVKDVIKKMCLTNLFEIEYIEETKLDLGFRRKIVLHCRSSEESLRDIFLFEDISQFVDIADIGEVKFYLFACNFFYSFHGNFFAVAEVVDDNHVVTVVDKVNDRMAADISGAACNQNAHIYVLL